TANHGADRPINYVVFGCFMIALWFLYRSFVKGADVGQISILHHQRAELERQRGRLLKWARGWDPPLVVLLGFNRFHAFLDMVFGHPLKSWDATPAQIWIDFATFSIWTLFFFVVVRKVNIQARQTVELEIEMLIASERSAG